MPSGPRSRLTPRQHVGVHGSGAYMIQAFHETNEHEFHETGRVYDRVVFLGFAAEHMHRVLRIFASRFPETAHLAVAPEAADQWMFPEIMDWPVLRLGSGMAEGWSVRARGSSFQLEPETVCGICGWSPYEPPPERKESDDTKP